LRCIIGLGNPGKKYDLTRHNIGFIIIDSFASKHKLSFLPSKHNYYYSEAKIISSEFFLLKPTTYMNLSGVAVKDFLNEYPINLEDILIIVDDINLPLGKIRIRKSGSDGGHNGLKSIIYHLQSDSFPRLRVGIGKNYVNSTIVNYVLEHFSSDEMKFLSGQTEYIMDLLESFVVGGFNKMIDKFSKKQREINNNNNSEEID